MQKTVDLNSGLWQGENTELDLGRDGLTPPGLRTKGGGPMPPGIGTFSKQTFNLTKIMYSTMQIYL